MNKRGFVVLEVLIVALVSVFSTVLLWKPITSTLGIGNQPQKQKSSWVKKSEVKPVLYYRDEKGNEHVAMAIKSEESNIESSEDRQLTLWQKIKNLGVGFIILMIAFPGTIGAWGIKTLFKAKENLKQIIQGVEEAKTKLPKESVDILEANLSKKMDLKVKNQVKAIKGKLIANAQ